MPTTAGGIRYPASSASINIPGDLQNLAEDVETYITANAVTTSGTFTLTNKTLTSPIITGDGVVFEGATADAFETALTVVDPTADRVITLPNSTGTVCLLDATQTLSNKTIDSPTFTGQVTGLELAFSQSIVFEGTTADASELTLTAGEPTADRVVTLPNATTTLVGTDTTDTLTNKTLTSPTVSGLTLSDASIVFEGATADAFETTITVTDPTADRTITFPNASGTVALADSVDATATTLSGLEIAVIMSAF